MQIVNKMKAVAPSEFFHTRHADVLHKYLPHFQQVMHIDADSLVLNIDRPLTVYLAASADVQLHLHESGEVTASNYIVKNSIYGKCFLRYWSRFRAGDELPFSLGSLRYETLNFDNGDLMAAVMNAVSPSAFASCMAEIGASEESTIRQYSNPYLELHVECWKRIFMDAYTNPTRHATEISEGLKIYLPRESYWRTFARKGRFGLWWDQLFGSCFEHSDIIGHGWKAMPRELWGGNHSCPAISGNNGHNEVCEWVSKALELELARKYCLWKSPVCLLDYSGTNKCIDDSSACSASGSLYSSLRATSMTEKKRKQVQLFNVGNEKWWRQQLCSWCPAEVPE